MACSIIRNKETNQIEKVLAPNGQESKLYQDILKINPDAEHSLKLWAQVYTPSFKAWFGDWENGQGSKVVDENGEPMILYHGSRNDEEFDTFEENKRGIFFTDNSEIAEVYAQANYNTDNIYPVFLSVNNLTNVDIEYLDEHRDDIDSSKEGYVADNDRIPNKPHKEFVVFNSNKIKSVFNEGTYSKEDNRIYFNRRVVPITEEEQKKDIGQSVVQALADRLTSNFGIEYNIVTPEQAKQLDSRWNGEGAFYLNGKVHIVEGHFTMENVLHEYSHPLIDAIFADNKTLFKNLYNSILATTEGQAIVDEVKQAYPEYKEGDSMFVKEVMVRALTKEAMSESTSKGFKEFIKKALFAIKQALRKMFGTKVKVENLSVKTSLVDLAKMLKTDEFEIDTDLVSEKDVAQYNRAVTEYVESLNDVETSEIGQVVDRFYLVTTNQLRRIQKNQNYSEARKILIDEDTKKGLLTGIKVTLDQTKIDEKLKSLTSDLEQRKKLATNFVHAVKQLEILSTKIQDHLSEIIKNKDSEEVLKNVFYYDLLVKNWSQFIKEANEALIDAGMDPSSKLGNLMSSVQTRVESIKRKINKAYTPGLVTVLADALGPLMTGIDEYYQKRIDELKKKNAPNELIQAEMKKWDESRLTEDKLKEILEGKHGDTNYFSAYLEAATNSPDPIIGGFAMFLKNNYNVVEAEFQRDMNNFVRDMEPLLKEAGYSRTNFTDLMSKLVFEDEYSYYDITTGEYKTKKVLTFLNEFRNRNVHLQKFKSDIEAAEQKGDEAEVDRLIRAQRQHLRDYFHQEYADAFYDREKIYDTFDNHPDLKKLAYEVYGVDESKATETQKNEVMAMYKQAADEAYRQKHTILNEIKQIDALNYDDSTFEQDLEEKKYLWRKYSQIASSLDLNGNPKQGMDKLTAAIEKKYRKESNKFFEWVPIEGQFEFSLKKFEQSLIDAGIAENSDDYKTKRDLWIKNNTVIAYTDKFYEERNEILTQLKDVMSQLPENIRNQIDSTAELEEQLGIAVGFRDQHGQIIGTELSDKSKAKLKSLQEAIVNKRNSMAGFSGLTKDEMEEVVLLYNKAKVRNITPEESDRLTQLINKKDSLGVNRAVKAELQRLYSLLGDIQSREATDYYMEILDNWFQKLGEPAPTRESADAILRPEQYTKLFKLDPEFEKWFKENHVAKEIYDKALDQNIIVYERMFAWNRTRPNNPDHYEKIKLSNGEEIQGKPNLNYYRRVVKDEFKTEKVVGKTVDNRGNWLPKTVSEGAKDDLYENKLYDRLRKSNPAAFKVLEKMKEYHLNFQKDAPRESRLYLEAPRYRSMAIEQVKKPKEGLSKGKQLLLNIRSVFITSKDNYEEGVNFNPGILVSANMFDEEIRKIPVTGIYDLKPEEVSLNFLDGMMQYRHSIMHQRKLIDLNPVSQALQNVLTDPRNAINDAKKISKWYYKLYRRVVPIKGKGESIRAKAVKNLYEREFEGKHNSIELIDRFPAIQKLQNSIAFMTSLGFFGLNLPSAFKNKIAAQEQALIESFGGRFFNASSYMRGKGLAWKMLAIHSSEVYATKNKSLETQLMQIFNPIQDMFEQMTKTQFGRSVASDVANLSILMAPRKFLQGKATLDIFAGMLYHVKVKQKIGNVEKEIPYASAWEIKNGQIELKPGISEEYAPGGKKFNEFKNRLHEVVNRLEGTYARMDQPELNRNYFFRMTIFMKKYFTSMFMNWFAKRRPSASLGTISTGNYANFIYIMKSAKTYGTKYFMYLSNEEKAALQKIAAQAISVMMINMVLIGMMFDYDEDDDDRFEKMRQRSGDMLSDDFKAGGWMQNQALVLALNVITETGTWYNPKIFFNTAMGLPNSSLLLEKGFETPYKILYNYYNQATGQGDPYYKKDVGPYSWQKEGGSKATTDLAKIFGFTGGTIDPVLGVKGVEGVRKGKFK